MRSVTVCRAARRTAAVGVEGDVGAPEQVGGPAVRRALDALGELLAAQRSRRCSLLGVEQLQRGDLVAVLVEVGAPDSVTTSRRVGVDDAVRIEQEVLAGLVDDEVVGTADLEQPVAQLGVGGQRLHGVVEQSPQDGGGVRVGAFGLRGLAIRSGSMASTRRRVMSFSGWPATPSSSARSAWVSSQVEPGEAGGEGGDLVFGDGEGGGLLQQLLERDRLVAVERRGVDVLVLGDPDRVDEHEPGLGRWRRG